MLPQIQPESLSPAQKAWATRRARDEARAHIIARKLGVAAPCPLAGHRIVRFYSEDAAIGLGWRHFVVVTMDARTVTLFYVPRLLNLKIDRLTFDRYARPARGSSIRRTEHLIREAIASWKQLFPEDCERACARAHRALAALRHKEAAQ